MFADLCREVEENPCAALWCGLGPRAGVEGAARGADGEIDFDGRGFNYLGEDFLRGGFEDGEGFARVVADPLAVDVELICTLRGQHAVSHGFLEIIRDFRSLRYLSIRTGSSFYDCFDIAMRFVDWDEDLIRIVLAKSA